MPSVPTKGPLTEPTELDLPLDWADTLALDGKTIDKPHLTLAHRLLGLGTE